MKGKVCNCKEGPKQTYMNKKAPILGARQWDLKKKQPTTQHVVIKIDIEFKGA